MDKNSKGSRLGIMSGRNAVGQKHREIWRPKIKAEDNSGMECPYCHSSIKSGYAICPNCGRSLTPGKCSFCGAPMKENAKFCTRCGQSRNGIECPNCGTLNSRNFCRKCNSPLTAMAQKALSEAQNDPAFKAVLKKADELAEIHARIEELRNTPSEQPRAELSDEDKNLLNEYADILGMIGVTPPAKTVLEEEQPKAERTRRRQYSARSISIDDLLKSYKEKATEMNDALAAMTPPPDFTPEQQRDYYSARKIATVVTTTACDMSDYRPMQWRCNLCGCAHNAPSECAQPELGGVWEYVSVDQYIAENTQIVSTTLKIE